MRKNNVILFFGIIFSTIMFLSSCNIYEPVTYGNVQKIEIKSISMAGVIFNVFIPVKNPNSYAISVLKYNLNVGLEKTVAGNVCSEEKIVIPAHSDSIQKIEVKTKIVDILSGLTAVYKIFSEPEVNIEIKGTVKVKALFLSKNIKIDQVQKVSVVGKNK